MRRARFVFLLAILGITVYVGVVYRRKMDEIRRKAPKKPSPLPAGLTATHEYWQYEKTSDNGTSVYVKAKEFRQIAEPSRFELTGVQMRLCRKGKDTCDDITSDRAEFDNVEGYLYSEGDAFITMGTPAEDSPDAKPNPHRLIHIKSSGIKFESATGKAETDREAFFSFEKGEGKSVGAVYDPSTRELHLRSQAQLTWYDKGANPRPMHVEAGEVFYKEHESKIYLKPWSKFSRANMTLEGKDAVVSLDDKGIRLVETTEAHGKDAYPGRQLTYSAASLRMSLSEKSEVEHIEGAGDARLTVTAEQGVTETKTNKVDLEFEAGDNGSTLRRVLATGASTVESRPAMRPGRPPADARILRSENIELKMRPNGQEIDVLDTLTPGVLEFLPNAPGQKRRRVDGERFHIAYGEGNRLDYFRASQAATRTEGEPKQGKPSPPSLTWSKELTAHFAAATGALSRLEQSGDFRYEEGERKAKSERALLDNANQQIALVQGARVSDPQGTTSADQIFIDQRTEDFRAEGNVQSSRIPDKKGAGSSMLSKDEPTQARALRMWTRESQSVVYYEGNAVLWQGASRLEADRIEIDRSNSVLIAKGSVRSQLLDQKKKAPSAAPVFTIVRSPSLLYSDKDRVAHYTGGATLNRPGLDVTAREIHAFLKPESKEGESSLDRATAEGQVVILQKAPDRTRRGTAEHAEYYIDEEKVVLEQGQPQLHDSVRGITRGRQLIYYANDDRLLVNGVPAQPARSKLRRK